MDALELQALLDPAADLRGMRILREVRSSSGNASDFYISGNVSGRGQCFWAYIEDALTVEQAATQCFSQATE